MQNLSFTRAFVMDTVVYKQNTKKINENEKEKNGINFHCIHRCELLPVYLLICIFFPLEFFSHDWNVWRHTLTHSGYGLIYRSEFAYHIYWLSNFFFRIAIAKLWKTHQPRPLKQYIPDHSLLSLFFGSQWNQRCNRKKARI